MRAINIKYGATLRKLRKQFQIKQTNLLEPLNLKTQQQISDLENGKKIFSEDLILRICDLFHISLLEFLNTSGQNAPITTTYVPTDDLEDQLCLNDSELLSAHYKKLYIGSKLENIEMKIKEAGGISGDLLLKPTKNKIFVII
jgi:transcriptional regulator with XRE-family HTH domain